jgi:hypothetical protein
MGTAVPRPGRAVLILAVVGLLLGFLYLAVAAPYLSSREEEMMLGRFPVVVSYSDSASPEELMLPFYPASEVQESFAYSVATKEGEGVVEYASASLTTADSWERVADYYSSELPGQPEAEAMEDESGKRYVFVVPGEEAVRTVTLRPTEEGSRINLVRATHPERPTRRVRPRRGESVI